MKRGSATFLSGIGLALVWLALPVGSLASETARGTADANAGSEYLVQPGDQLVISVWREPDLSGEVLVRPDGGLSAPLMGDIEASGKTVTMLAQQIRERLIKYIPEPEVTVAIREITGNRFYVLGKVARPGEYLLSRPMDVLQALSVAGGTNPFAATDEIQVLRRIDGQLTAIPFRYSEVASGRNLEKVAWLKAGDTVLVP